MLLSFTLPTTESQVAGPGLEAGPAARGALPPLCGGGGGRQEPEPGHPPVWRTLLSTSSPYPSGIKIVPCSQSKGKARICFSEGARISETVSLTERPVSYFDLNQVLKEVPAWCSWGQLLLLDQEQQDLSLCSWLTHCHSPTTFIYLFIFLGILCILAYVPTHVTCEGAIRSFNERSYPCTMHTLPTCSCSSEISQNPGQQCRNEGTD